MTRDSEDFRALDPFFRIIEEGLQGLVDGEHFFELLADDVVFVMQQHLDQAIADLAGTARGSGRKETARRPER